MQYHFIGLQSLREALDLSSRLSLDLLIVDVLHPGMNGRKIADQISLLQPNLKVLLTSSYARAVMSTEICPLGCALLTKPFSPSLLQAKINMILKLHRGWRSQFSQPKAASAAGEDLLLPLDDTVAI